MPTLQSDMAKTGKTIKTEDLENLGGLQCTVREAAAFLRIRVTTLNDILRKNKKAKEAWERGKQMGLISLRRKQMRLARTNAAMGIFLGKNYLGQREVTTHQLTGEDGGPVDIDVGQLPVGERNELRKLLNRATVSKSGKENS